jgi:hypothetical protein
MNVANGGGEKKPPTMRFGAGWSSPVARQAHNLKVVGSNPTPATKSKTGSAVRGRRPDLQRVR